MPISKKVILCWILVILWAGLIFFMSNMNNNASNSKSKSTINTLVEKTVETTNEIGLTNKHPSERKMTQVINKLNKPLRKVAHVSEYCVFTILILIVLKNSGLNGKKLFLVALLICFLYACSDEYHQTFVNGRTGQFTDALIDTLGGTIGCFIYKIGNKIHNKKKKSVNI